MIGYIKHMQIKIVRTLHRVTIGEGLTANSVREYLSSIPDKARLTGIYYPDEVLPELRLEFVEETVADDSAKEARNG